MRVFVTLVALFSPVGLPAADETPTPAEQKAIGAVARAGGKATIDPKLAPEARVAAKFEAAADGTLVALAKVPELGAIDVLDATKVTERGLAALPDLPHLRKLVLGKSKLSAAGAAAVGKCKELRYLGLVDAGLTDAELAAMKGLTRLEHLSLSNNRITDKGMQTVKGFERLRELYLANTALTDKGLAELKGLDGLRTLNLVNTKVTADACEKFVDEMPNLRGIRR